MPIVTSPANGLVVHDWKSIGKGALVMITGTLLTYLPPLLTGMQYVVTIGGKQYDFTALVIILISGAVNIVRKWYGTQTYVTE